MRRAGAARVSLRTPVLAIDIRRTVPWSRREDGGARCSCYFSCRDSAIDRDLVGNAVRPPAE